MLRRTLAALAAIGVLIAGAIVAAAPASAAAGMWCDVDTCVLTISSPPSDPAPNPDSNGWTPGAQSCLGQTNVANIEANGIGPDSLRVLDIGNGAVEWYVTMGCGNGEKYWSNNRQCYVSMIGGQWPARPAQFSQDAGYYACEVPSYITGVNQNRANFWSETVPPGLQVLTPGRAAAQLIDTFQLRGVDIGMAPGTNPSWGHRRSYVGVPVWLWVENPQPLTWGPYTQTATLGGQTITATAQVSGIRWNMGDGREVVCGSPGTAYSIGYGLSDSPTCGHRYGRTSQNQPGDRYTVTATSQWSVTWTSLSGASGTVNLTTSNSTQLEINEIQSVNVKPNTPNG